MTAPLHFETLIPSLLDTTVSAFQNGSIDVANNILMNLIFSLKEQNNELKSLLFKLDTEPTISTSLDNEDFHNSMIIVEDMAEKLLYVSKQHKEKSDIFNELYKISEDMFANSITLSNEVSAVASELRHKELQFAS